MNSPARTKKRRLFAQIFIVLLMPTLFVVCDSPEVEESDVPPSSSSEGEAGNAQADAVRSSNERSTDVYIVAFKPVSPFAPRTAEELFDAFNRHQPRTVRSHHFRTRNMMGHYIGYICIDGEAGKLAVEEMFKKAKQIELIEVDKATPKMLEQLYAMEQPSPEQTMPSEPRAAATAVASVEDTFEFELFDIFGRKITSADYVGVPIFLEFGACW